MFEVRAYWIDHPEKPERVAVYGPFNVYFASDVSTRSFVFRLQNVPLPGAGRYAIRLRAISPVRRALATEYIEVRETP